VVPTEHPLAVLHGQIQAFNRIWSVPDNIAKAKYFIHSLILDIFENSTECLEISVNV